MFIILSIGVSITVSSTELQLNNITGIANNMNLVDSAIFIIGVSKIMDLDKPSFSIQSCLKKVNSWYGGKL